MTFRYHKEARFRPRAMTKVLRKDAQQPGSATDLMVEWRGLSLAAGSRAGRSEARAGADHRGDLITFEGSISEKVESEAANYIAAILGFS